MVQDNLKVADMKSLEDKYWVILDAMRLELNNIKKATLDSRVERGNVFTMVERLSNQVESEIFDIYKLTE